MRQTAEVLPHWRARIDAIDPDPAVRDIFLIDLYTGMSMGEIPSLRRERMDLERRILRVEFSSQRFSRAIGQRWRQPRSGPDFPGPGAL